MSKTRPGIPKWLRKKCRRAWRRIQKNSARSAKWNEPAAIGAELLTEDEYLALQKLGEFDTKTSSWLRTPDEIRKLGGALFGARRYGRAFIYHNGAQSYFADRGFRCSLKV